MTSVNYELRLLNAYIDRWIGSSLVQLMDCCLFAIGSLFQLGYFEFCSLDELIFFFRKMLHLELIIMFFMVNECQSLSNGKHFIQGSPGFYLNCIDLRDITPRSVIECALYASHLDHYDNSFAYHNGNCHVCRADSANCNVSPDEYRLAGPHFFKGERFIIISNGRYKFCTFT